MHRGEVEADLYMLEGDRPRKSWWEEESLALLNHDLRNALASVTSALQILRLQGYVNPLAEQAGRTIERQAEHLARLADQLSVVAGTPKPRAPVRAKRPSARTMPAIHRRILVVDDNRDAADSTGTLLLLWGHEVRVAYDGTSAVTVAKEYRPDVCLLDLSMPGLNGYQVAEQLRREPSLQGLLVVAMTGFDQESERNLSNAAGFDAYLVKPVELDALQEILAQKSPPKPLADDNGPARS